MTDRELCLAEIVVAQQLAYCWENGELALLWKKGWPRSEVFSFNHCADVLPGYAIIDVFCMMNRYGFSLDEIVYVIGVVGRNKARELVCDGDEEAAE